MKRRGFLGMLGGAAVAGPAMAKQAVTSGLEAMSLGVDGGMLTKGVGYANMAFQGGGQPVDYVPPSPLDPDHWLQRELRDLLGMSKEDLDEWRKSIHVGTLDPDLVANRSFSLAGKISIQREREFQRMRDNRRSNLEREIRIAIKRWREQNLPI